MLFLSHGYNIMPHQEEGPTFLTDHSIQNFYHLNIGSGTFLSPFAGPAPRPSLHLLGEDGKGQESYT